MIHFIRFQNHCSGTQIPARSKLDFRELLKSIFFFSTGSGSETAYLGDLDTCNYNLGPWRRRPRALTTGPGGGETSAEMSLRLGEDPAAQEEPRRRASDRDHVLWHTAAYGPVQSLTLPRVAKALLIILIFNFLKNSLLSLHLIIKIQLYTFSFDI